MELKDFKACKNLAQLVKWEESSGTINGIIEAQKPGWFRIYVFNKDTYGTRRAVKRAEDVLFI